MGGGYLKNLLLYITYNLPGVFENNIYPNAVNGSLWTLPVEVAMYVLIPIIFWIAGYRKDKSNSMITVGAISFITAWVCCAQLFVQLFSPNSRWVFWGTDWAQALAIVPYYFIGIFVAVLDVKKYLNLQLAIVLMLGYSCLILTGGQSSFAFLLVFPYLIFSFAFSETPVFANMFSKYDISYGLYLYGFFVQQIIMYIFVNNRIVLSHTVLLIICIMFTTLIALFSCVFVEHPTQKLCEKWLTHTIK